MDVREKLVELLNKANSACVGTDCFEGCKFYMENDCLYKLMADVMIENGVTVQECGHWISLTECANAGVYCSVCHKKVYKEDYAWCNRKNKLRSDYCPHCGAKMTPQPPKGE